MIFLYLLFLMTIYKNFNVVTAHLDMTLPNNKNAFDLNLYESVLDPELCEEQIRYMQQSDLGLLLQFIDAGIRIPKGVLTGNTLDLGNYHQCLGINKATPNSVIEGKYCMIVLPLDQSLPTLSDLPGDLPDLLWPVPDPEILRLKDEDVRRLAEFNLQIAGIQAINGIEHNASRSGNDQLAALTFRQAVCIPKSCSTRTALSSFFNNTNLNLNFEESYCRLPNDKPWVAGDYVAIAIFSFFGLLAVLSTAYDVCQNVLLEKDPKQINKLYIAFSAYTNTRRLVTYTPVPGAIECLDGIRAFAMMWVILGHSFATQGSSGLLGNPFDVFTWMISLEAIWVTAAPITVDTFFMLSGFLIVYTTAGKLSGMKLLKNIHLFYLNRLLRMFPVLAATILLQVSLLNWVSDGPFWMVVASRTHNCRVFWWSTLLHIQNYLNPANMCLGHTWYLAIDVQLHIISPLVLFWVLSGRRRLAWTALVVALLAVLAASTTYNFIKKFPPGSTVPSRPQDGADYLYNYYVNTLTRASPFFVGLIFGYILHLSRGKKMNIPWIAAILLWLCALTMSTLIVYSVYPIAQFDWNNEFADGMINSFMRPAWALFVGWLIFTCEHGYSGPINWFLSLRAWKVLSRLSYAMYLVHYPMMFVVNAMPVTHIYFSLQSSLFQFLANFSLAVIVAFIVTILIDAPCSVLIKHFMGGGPKKLPLKVEETAEEKKSEFKQP